MIALSGLLLILLILGAPLAFVFTSKQPLWIKCFMTGNYLTMLAVITIFLGMKISLLTASKMAEENLTVLTEEMVKRPAEEIVPVLEDYLNHDEGTYFRISEQFPVP